MKLRDELIEMLWVILIFLLLYLLSLMGRAQVNDLGDPQFISRLIPSTGVEYPSDDFESYTAAAGLNGLSGGQNWAGAYSDAGYPTGIQAIDNVEDYTDGAALNALNFGGGFAGAFADGVHYLGIKSVDDMESYSDTAALNGLSGGSGWLGNFVDR